MSHKFIVNIAGPSCSGKSFLSDALMDRFPGAFKVSYDKLKWQLSGYSRDKDIPIIKRLTLGLFELVCAENIPILIDGWISNEEEYLRCEKVANEDGYKFVSVTLAAPLDVLLERFRERIKSASTVGSKISVTDEKVFLENNAITRFSPADALVYDTSVTEVRYIVEALSTQLG